MTRTTGETGRVRTAVDIGGTFTDVFIDDGSGSIRTAKVATQKDPIDGVLLGMQAADVDWRDVALFSHGTTIATNALITRRFPRIAVVTTEGFRDVIEIRRGNRDDLWDTYKEMAAPYVARRHRLTVSERVTYAGHVETPLDEEQARDVARILRRRQVEAVAVCLVNSFANPINEVRLAEILTEELPGVSVTTSSDVLPEIFEYERFSTTVANAALAPIISPYAASLEGRLTDAGYDGDVLLLHSGGGVMTPSMAEKFGARLAASGIAAGAIASRHIARMCGFENSIGFDMGGTSTDVSLTDRGVLNTTTNWYVEYGYPICFPSIEVLTIGAGGGSIAWLDDGGALRNGPQSAGSDPGPACYGGSEQFPTNTDANLVLGIIGDELVGGGMKLDRAASVTALARLGEPLGLDLEETAQAVLRVANSNMADAIRLISIRKGHDPRDFALVGFGGAGPLHAADLAKNLDIPAVIVPPHPGVTSAMGCMLVDIQHDLPRMYLSKVDDVDAGKVADSFRELEEEGKARLEAENVAQENMAFQWFIDMRYEGQWRAIAVEVDRPFDTLAPVVDRFHIEHGREHNYSSTEAPVEIYRLSVRAIGVTPKPDLAPATLKDPSECHPEPVAHREVLFVDETEAVRTAIYDRSDLEPGTVLEGPCVIGQLDSTTAVPPGTRARVDEWHNLQITLTRPTA